MRNAYPWIKALTSYSLSAGSRDCSACRASASTWRWSTTARPANGWCGVLYTRFAHGGAARSHVWYRWFNEVPVLLLTAIVVLAVVKPF
jgi:hypothetical protein